MADSERGRHHRFGRTWMVTALADDRLWIALASGAFLLAVLPFLALDLYNQPSADDFCLTNRVLDQGFAGFNRSIYMGWTGRFLTTVLYGGFYLVSAAFTRMWPLAFQLASVATFLALLVALHLALRSWSPHAWGGSARIWGVTALIAATWILGMPSLYEGLYWAASTLQYAFSVVWLLGLVAAGAALLPSAGATRRRAPSGVLGVIMAVAAIGSNETIAAPVFAFVILMLIASWRDRACRAWWLAITASALLALAVLLAAPGNYVRLGFVETLSVPGALARTAFLVGELRSWARPELFMSMVLVMLLSVDAPAALVGRWPHPCLVALGMVTVLAGMLLPSVWAYHGGVPPRVMSTIYLVFVPFAATLGLQLAVYLREAYPQLVTRLRAGAANRDLRLLIAATAILSLANSPNLRPMGRDLALGYARTFRDISEQRYAIAAHAAPGSAVSFAPIEKLPTTLALEDLSTDTGHWKNVCFATRFGLSTVHTERPAARGER